MAPDARVVAWLHEVLEHTATSEEELLRKGVSAGELRALRLLTRDPNSRSNASYLGHVEMIARARGDGARIARTVKRVDLKDRLLSPRTAGAWAPPYELALQILHFASTELDT